MPQEVVETLVRAADVRIERIISHGHASPADFWYDQPQHEWVIVLKGAARLQFEDSLVEWRWATSSIFPPPQKASFGLDDARRTDRVAWGAVTWQRWINLDVLRLE
jgi:hypothetical protein